MLWLVFGFFGPHRLCVITMGWCIKVSPSIVTVPAPPLLTMAMAVTMPLEIVPLLISPSAHPATCLTLLMEGGQGQAEKGGQDIIIQRVWHIINSHVVKAGPSLCWNCSLQSSNQKYKSVSSRIKMGLEDKSLARFWVSSLRACKEGEGEGHRRNASFHAEQACQCKISSSLP